MRGVDPFILHDAALGRLDGGISHADVHHIDVPVQGAARYWSIVTPEGERVDLA